MPSALTGIAVQIAAGIVACSAVALAVKEYSFGIVKSTVTGALGGIGSYLLEAVIPLTVTAAGSWMIPRSMNGLFARFLRLW